MAIVHHRTLNGRTWQLVDNGTRIVDSDCRSPYALLRHMNPSQAPDCTWSLSCCPGR